MNSSLVPHQSSWEYVLLYLISFDDISVCIRPVIEVLSSDMAHRRHWPSRGEVEWVEQWSTRDCAQSLFLLLSDNCRMSNEESEKWRNIPLHLSQMDEDLFSRYSAASMNGVGWRDECRRVRQADRWHIPDESELEVEMKSSLCSRYLATVITRSGWHTSCTEKNILVGSSLSKIRWRISTGKMGSDTFWDIDLEQFCVKMFCHNEFLLF